MNKSSFDIILDKKEKVALTHLEQLAHTAIVGSKRLSEKDDFFAHIVCEAVRLRNVSSTFFVSSKDESFRIYSLAKKMKRRVVMISPSFIPFSEDLSIGSFDRVVDYIRYSNYIYNDYIVVVDVEYMKNKSLSKKFIDLMLNIIERSVLDTEKTALKKHNIYFDDAHLYLDRVSELMYYGREYNVSLFFFVRNCLDFFGDKNIKLLVNNCGNKIVLNSASELDKEYFLVDKNDCLDTNAIVVINNKKTKLEIKAENISSGDYFELSEKEIKSLKRLILAKISRYESKVLSSNSREYDSGVLKSLDSSSNNDELLVKIEEKFIDDSRDSRNIRPNDIKENVKLNIKADKNAETSKSVEERRKSLFGRQGREELIIDYLLEDMDDFEE